ncbi:MAG: type 2 isopentenyl-diphosphate Delta-isomerase [Actinobacteria bacterium]|nr:type 2 isopentenyl-diphosphate Delta-isomerase [Actinomycetota bacterium]
MSGEIRKRKAEHLELAGGGSVEPASGPGWDDVELVHEALPEAAAEEVDLAVELLGHRLELPLVIAGMTGGHPGAAELNAALGRAAQRHGCAVGVGSQRAALADPSLEPTYAALREAAPDAFVIANIGAAQLIPQGARPPLGPDEVARLIAMVDADALAVHLNFLEEAVQPEGDRAVRGCAEAIAALAAGLAVPLIVKETGAGMHEGTARRLLALGADALDVGGAGGTSFALVERLRAERQGDARGVLLGSLLADWGIPTAVAVASCSRAGLPVIATGGVRNGLDAAKALALGATAVGVARPLLLAAQAGADGPSRWIEDFALELRTVLMLTGCRRPGDLAERPRVLAGRVGRWVEALERQPAEAAR